MMIAVHIHCFYENIMQEIFKYLDNLSDYSYDLYITIPNCKEWLKEIVLQKFPQARVMVLENIAFDIYPFTVFLAEIDLLNYDYIIKLHTKNDMPDGFSLHGRDLSGGWWRQNLVGSILGSKKRVKLIFDLFDSEQMVGMIGSKDLLISGEKMVKLDIDVREVEKVLKHTNMNIKKHEFVAGTIFIARASLFHELKKNPFRKEDFPAYSPINWNGLTYCLERYFGYMVSAQGYSLFGIENDSSLQVDNKIHL